MKNDIESVLYSEQELQDCVKRIAGEITRDFAGKEPIFVGVLKGSFIFIADLMRHVDLHCSVDFMAVSSYGSGSVTTGAVKINKDLTANIEGKPVIMVEDILDSGLTLSYLTKYLQQRKPASISIATLLDKPARRTANITADFAGFEIENKFVVGYGLDYAGDYRTYPEIWTMEEDDGQ